MSNLYRSFLH